MNDDAPLPPATTQPSGAGARELMPDGPPLPPFAPVNRDSRDEDVDPVAASPTAPSPSAEPVPMPLPVPVPEPERATPPPAATPAEQAEAEGAFPLDAFIIPEDARRVLAGFGGAEGAAASATDAPTPAVVLANRLERMAGMLRAGGVEALASQLGRGDRLDTLLAGLLSGYLAGRDG